MGRSASTTQQVKADSNGRSWASPPPSPPKMGCSSVAVAAAAAIDRHTEIPVERWREGRARRHRAPSLIITGGPLHQLGVWEGLAYNWEPEAVDIFGNFHVELCRRERDSIAAIG